MNKEERTSLAEVQSKLKEIHGDLHFIRHEIRVNGETGLQPILIQLNKKVSNVEDRTTFLEKITAKTRSSYELWGAIQRWAEQHKMFALIIKLFLNKTMFKVLMVLFGILCVALFGDRALSLLNRISHLIK